MVIYTFYVAHLTNDVRWRNIVTKLVTLMENMSRTDCMTARFFKIYFDDCMRNSNFGIGVLHVKRKYYGNLLGSHIKQKYKSSSE